MIAPRSSTGESKWWVLLLALGIPLLFGFVLRLLVPPYLEFESVEDLIRIRLLLEQGQVPLYGIGRIRFTDSALGPMIYYFKGLPYLLGGGPEAEIVYLRVLHLAGMTGLVWTVRRALGTATASVFALLWAISTFSIALSAMPHASFYSTGFMGLVIFFMDQGVVRRRPWALIGLGVVLGIMTQFYQLTLFVPIWVILAMLIYRPSLPGHAWRAGVLALVLCYLPYLLSELLTGFGNTRGLFAWTGGVGDNDMVKASVADNLGVLLTVLVDTWGLPRWVGGVLFLSAIAGLILLIRKTIRTVRDRTYRGDGVVLLAFWGLFFSTLPTLILGDARYQMLSPFPQLLAAIGLSTALAWGYKLLQDLEHRTAFLRLGLWASMAGLIILSNVLFAQDPDLFWLYNRRIFPIWVAPGGEAHEIPDFPEVRDTLDVLHRMEGLSTENRGTRLHGFWMGSGVYGTPFILREVEQAVDSIPPDDGSILLLTDDLFRYDIKDAEEVDLGLHGRYAFKYSPRLMRDEFHLHLVDDSGLPRESLKHIPRVLYFGGCNEFRQLTGGDEPTPFDCRILRLDMMDWVYEGPLELPPVRQGVSEVLAVQVSARCAVEINVDEQPLEIDWVWRARHGFGYAVIPEHVQRSTTLEVVIKGCVPYTFDIFEFSGVGNANLLRVGEVP
jgi:hypothetical protein